MDNQVNTRLNNEETYCDLCQGKELKYLFDGHDRYYGIEGIFKIYKCLSCGLMITLPRLSEKDISRYYPSNYYSYINNNVRLGYLYKIKYAITNPLEILNYILYNYLLNAERGYKIVKNGKILDFGCGNGSFLLKFRPHGMDCYGIDIDQEAIKKAKENNIKAFCSFYEANFNDNFFDIILASHVLEHTTEPDKILEEFTGLLKPKGILIINVPNFDSCNFKLFNECWMPLDIPRHRYSFSTEIMKKSIEKNGLRIIRIRHIPIHYTFMGSLQYYTNKFHRKEVLLINSKLIKNQLLIFLIFPFIALFNLIGKGDNIEIWAQKDNKPCSD